MATSIILKMGSKTWEFDSHQAADLKGCSELIKIQIEEREELDPDNEEPIEIEIFSNDLFQESHVEECFEYLRKNGYKPPEYGKVISGTIEKNIEDDAGKDLAAKYDMITIKPLGSAAQYLQIKSLMRLCLIRVATEVYIDTNQSGAVQLMMEL